MTNREAIDALLSVHAESATPLDGGEVVALVNGLVAELSLATALLARQAADIERLSARIEALERKT